jgi:uncharacterized protein
MEFPLPSLHHHPAGISFKIHVQPKSSRNRVAGLYGDALKVHLTAPPVDGAANKMCVRFLAECLEVSRATVELLSGHSSRTKQILVRCTPVERVRLKARIANLLTV